MSSRTIPQAPDPHQAPPLATATRRHLFGTMGAALLLTAAEAGPAKAAELDGELLAACVAFQRINRDYVAANYDPHLTEQRSEHLYEERRTLALCITACVARTPEGLVAKAQAARAAMHADVPEYLTDTFLECADYHDLLADSLCRDLLGRAGA